MNHGAVRIGTVSGSDITFGAESLFLTPGTSTLDVSVAFMSPTAFAVSYEDAGSTVAAFSKVGTVSGTDATFGSAAEFRASGATGSPQATAGMSASSFVVVYRDGNNLNHATAKVGNNI